MEKRIREEYKTSIKEKNETVKRTLSLLINEIQNESKVQKRDLTEDEITKIINKEVKKRNQSIEMYTKGQRIELASKEEEELELLQSYLPTAYTEEELIAIINEIKSKNEGIIEGKLIGLVNKEVNGRNNINQIKETIKNLA